MWHTRPIGSQQTEWKTILNNYMLKTDAVLRACGEVYFSIEYKYSYTENVKQRAGEKRRRNAPSDKFALIQIRSLLGEGCLKQLFIGKLARGQRGHVTLGATSWQSNVSWHDTGFYPNVEHILKSVKQNKKECTFPSSTIMWLLVCWFVVINTWRLIF